MQSIQSSSVIFSGTSFTVIQFISIFQKSYDGKATIYKYIILIYLSFQVQIREYFQVCENRQRLIEENKRALHTVTPSQLNKYE